MAFGELQSDLTRGFPNGSPRSCTAKRWHEEPILDYTEDMQCENSEGFFFFARIFSKTSDVTFPICFDVERSDTKSDFDPS